MLPELVGFGLMAMQLLAVPPIAAILTGRTAVIATAAMLAVVGELVK
jgi:hypothetical protein